MNIVEGKNIELFERDAIVCQVKRSTTGDGSYFGMALKYKGIVNNLIYFTVETTKYPWSMGQVVKVDYERWSNCWNNYVDPEFALGVKEEVGND